MKDYNVWKMIGIHTWGVNEIKQVMLNSGYGADDVVDAAYDAPMHNGVVFRITYDDSIDQDGEARIYLKLNTDGFLRAEF
jgi:hypothetical protein